MFRNNIHWFRIGAWDFRTLAFMLALRFGTTRDRHAMIPALRKVLDQEERLIVLDNHEDDRATARLLEAFATTRATFVITARRCLLSGVLIYPVTAPLVTSQKSAFPRVSRLTRMLRWNPLALAIADAIVRSKSASAASLGKYLEAHHISNVHPIEHEDDLPEVALLVAWAWARLPLESRRVLAVLAHIEGDHVDIESLDHLAKAKHRAIAPLLRWQLVQEAMPARFTLHAVVRHAVKKRTKPSPRRAFDHYMDLLENHPERLELEQSHLFAAMDYAHRTSSLNDMLRVERLLTMLGET
jgi:hypothetical protein